MQSSFKSGRRRIVLVALTVLVSAAAACGGDEDTSISDSTGEASTSQPDSSPVEDQTEEPSGESVESDEESVPPSVESSTLVAEVWADNWFALYANGELVGEDSVPITTERSFNAETIEFDATYPLILGIEAKDFKETDSGIEYIGLGNQQMGDGGLIAQITDTTTGEVVVATNADWTVLVVHRAPLNTDCERDADPDATCEFEITDTPSEWATQGFDDGEWSTATVWAEADVGPKDGYDQITWSPSAELIWGADLEVDNTILFRSAVLG